MRESEETPRRYTGPDGARLAWVERAIAVTDEWVAREEEESRGELAFSRPGSWDYDYNTDVIRQTRQAKATLEALRAERELIRGCQERLWADEAAGRYADER